MQNATRRMQSLINDLLTYAELSQLLTSFGFTNVRRTTENRNHYVAADKLTLR